MILVDTSVWIDHFRHGDSGLVELLEASQVIMHPWIVGELALGNLRQRTTTIELLSVLPQLPVVDHWQLIDQIDLEHLFGLGIGFVDAQLLASVTAVEETRLWTRDRRLDAIAERWGIRFAPMETAPNHPLTPSS